MFKTGKKYSLGQKLAYYKKKALGSGKGKFYKKGRIFKSKNIRKPVMGMIKSIENIVRNMGPPRNVQAFNWGIVDSVNQGPSGQQGSNNLVNSMLLVSLCSQGNLAVAIGAGNIPAYPTFAAGNIGDATNNNGSIGVFPTLAAGATGINNATTNEIYCKKLKTRITLTPMVYGGDPEAVPPTLPTLSPISGFRVLHFVQRRELQGNGLVTGSGSVFPPEVTQSCAAYGLPLTYAQLINPQFFTHFKLLSDKIHKVFTYSAYDGANATNAQEQQNELVSATTASLPEVIIDFSTYVNKKLVNFTDQTANSEKYPQNFPSTSKSFLLILPVVGTQIATGSYQGATTG